jgi:hypothetical protein
MDTYEQDAKTRNEEIAKSIKQSRDVIDQSMRSVTTCNDILQKNKDTAHSWAGKIDFGKK